MTANVVKKQLVPQLVKFGEDYYGRNFLEWGVIYHGVEERQLLLHPVDRFLFCQHLVVAGDIDHVNHHADIMEAAIPFLSL